LAKATPSFAKTFGANAGRATTADAKSAKTAKAERDFII
jgi:hypothetical protein